MALYRFRKGDQQPSDVIIHYGRSIRDGAPGVGTGNWDRGGMSPGTAISTGGDGPTRANFRLGLFGRIKYKKKVKQYNKEQDRLEEENPDLVKRGKELRDKINKKFEDYWQSDRIEDDAKDYARLMTEHWFVDDVPREGSKEWTDLVNDIIGDDRKDLFWRYEALRDKELSDLDKEWLELAKEMEKKGIDKYR